MFHQGVGVRVGGLYFIIGCSAIISFLVAYRETLRGRSTLRGGKIVSFPNTSQGAQLVELLYLSYF